MYELAIVERIVEAAVEHAGVGRVRRLVLEIGKLSTVAPDAVRFAFDVVAEGTPMEGAELEIVEIAGRGRCRSCDAPVVVERRVERCGCGGADLEWVEGTGVKIVRLEVR